MRLAVGAALLGAITAGPVYSYSLQSLPAGLTPNQACAAAVGGQAANVVDENSLAVAALIFNTLGSSSMAAVGSWYDQTYGGGCIMGIVSSTSATLAVYVYPTCPAGSMVVCSTPSKPYGYTGMTGTTTVTRTTTTTQTTASTVYISQSLVTETVTSTSDVLITVTTTTSLVSPTATYPVPTTIAAANPNYVMLQGATDLVTYDQAEQQCELYGMDLAYIPNVSLLSFPGLATITNAWVEPYAPNTAYDRSKIGGTFTSSSPADTHLISFNILTGPGSALPSDVVCMISDGAGGQTFAYLRNQGGVSSYALANNACIANTVGTLASLPGETTSPFGVPAGGTSPFLAWAQINSPTNFVCAYWAFSPFSDSMLRLVWDLTGCTGVTGYPICKARGSSG